ncbi:hypothetical protein BU24DRAFT_213450 [Aaosphaeria arxii CBS 175.79]|uniref:SRR1-like domain-containing protein n=1 Tax=Aaosphaeria arxii CBS 175.79 TaxID=1450172 RepID=A0A6A5XN93_9PLEO|nr:uncharacterized protein BU24DRAFT_213450 [Aaosphaeria arxii CBS 175.79]KAF2014359.1 hypothetical protein BU24DRAFT_213450 [Aaosphaeria arxii CBS 175.79]
MIFSEITYLPQDDGAQWRKSSQLAANLYNGGGKLWTKDDLRDIEQQLAHSDKHEFFTVRLIDGTEGRVKNEMFGEKQPIWQPRVKYQEYWRLVDVQPKGPPEIYRCSYLIHWENISVPKFLGVLDDSDILFEEAKVAWDKSSSRSLFKSLLENTFVIEKVTKIVCFGLGDMCRNPPEWYKPDTNPSRRSKVQHSIALTMAEICRASTGNEVQLLAQDPDYTESSINVLQKHDVSIVGHYGAGGFAEVDNNSIVFSAFVQAPLKQIIADIARPLIIITTRFGTFGSFDHGQTQIPREQERCGKNMTNLIFQYHMRMKNWWATYMGCTSM